MILAGAILHLLILVVPIMFVGEAGPMLADPVTLAFLAGVSALYAGDAVTMRWRSSEAPSPRNEVERLARRCAALTGVVLLLLFWTALLERTATAPGGSWLRIAGATLLPAGVVLRSLAVRTLGSSFRTELAPAGRALVTYGVYGLVRHPSETGLLAASLGAALMLESTAALALWAFALVPCTLARVALEERALVRHFGEAYARYAERVGALL